MEDLQTVDIVVFSDADCERIHAGTGPTYSNYHVCAGIPEGGKGQCSVRILNKCEAVS
jgi:trypsin